MMIDITKVSDLPSYLSCHGGDRSGIAGTATAVGGVKKISNARIWAVDQAFWGSRS